MFQGVSNSPYMMPKVIDFHTHVGRDKDGTALTIDSLLRSMLEAYVTYSVVFPMDDPKKSVEEASVELSYDPRFIRRLCLLWFLEVI